MNRTRSTDGQTGAAGFTCTNSECTAATICIGLYPTFSCFAQVFQLITSRPLVSDWSSPNPADWTHLVVSHWHADHRLRVTTVSYVLVIGESPLGKQIKNPFLSSVVRVFGDPIDKPPSEKSTASCCSASGDSWGATRKQTMMMLLCPADGDSAQNDQTEEYGSVASTPDSTPPCSDGGNEESEMYELQTAREWSDEEEGGDGDPDDDEGLASSSSIWGTPRQNSFELTFSYIAIADAEAVGASRHHRDRRRGGSRGSRTPLIHTDTLETLLDSPDIEWDPEAFLSREEEEDALGRREQETVELRMASTAGSGEREQQRHIETITIQPSSQNLDPETEGREAGIQREETPRLSQFVQPPSPPSASQQQSPIQILQAAALPTPEPEPLITGETISVKLLTSVQPRGPASSSPAAIDLNSQEQLVSDHWFSALNLSEDLAACTHMAVMDLIYWKDMERTGMVLTGLVVGLLSLFQLSIITVVSTVSLAVMCFTISVRIYYQVLYILSWGDGEHPFKSYLDLDISFSGEQADLYMQKAIIMVLSAADTLKRLLFVGNLFDSIKLLVLMYFVTYLGDLCGGLTLLIISVIALFSLPLFYRRRQEQVDGFIAKIQGHVNNIKDLRVDNICAVFKHHLNRNPPAVGLHSE
uniref:reticulon-2a isoform X3 n=1 Tax=Monopterus albus TaxID=43700 RepID=UPI0009B4E083|nr:reticulon-2-like isoform X3 [Monopterus albus]